MKKKKKKLKIKKGRKDKIYFLYNQEYYYSK